MIHPRLPPLDADTDIEDEFLLSSLIKVLTKRIRKYALRII